VSPRGLRRGQVNFRSHNSCLSLGEPSPGRRRACVLFGVSFRGGYSPTGLPGDTVWLALFPTGWGGLSVLSQRGQRQRGSVVVSELRRARKRGIVMDDHQRGSGGGATRTVKSRGDVGLTDYPPWKISQRERSRSASQPSVLRWKAISRHRGARFKETFGCEWAGIGRTDDRYVKQTDTAPDLFPLSPSAVGKAQTPSFQLGKQLLTMEWIDEGEKVADSAELFTRAAAQACFSLAFR